jgi:hypothetical protein
MTGSVTYHKSTADQTIGTTIATPTGRRNRETISARAQRSTNPRAGGQLLTDNYP